MLQESAGLEEHGDGTAAESTTLNIDCNDLITTIETSLEKMENNIKQNRVILQQQSDSLFSRVEEMERLISDMMDTIKQTTEMVKVQSGDNMEEC